MNKPAPKEPSMDEILSSIRQIIADDDAAAVPRTPAMPAASAPAQPVPVPRAPLAASPAATASARPAPESDAEPLALTRDQMLKEDAADPPGPISFSDILGEDNAGEVAEPEGAPKLVDPEDVTFDSEDDEESGMTAFSVPMDEPEPAHSSWPEPPSTSPAPRPAVARTAPMPDPTLSADLAERLLEPTTDAAVQHTFAKLSGLSMAGSGQTIDTLLRDMLRPMLKEWLDENLPAIVERMVEKEISRISRGGE